MYHTPRPNETTLEKLIFFIDVLMKHEKEIFKNDGANSPFYGGNCEIPGKKNHFPLDKILDFLDRCKKKHTFFNPVKLNPLNIEVNEIAYAQATLLNLYRQYNGNLLPVGDKFDSKIYFQEAIALENKKAYRDLANIEFEKREYKKAFESYIETTGLDRYGETILSAQELAQMAESFERMTFGKRQIEALKYYHRSFQQAKKEEKSGFVTHVKKIDSFNSTGENKTYCNENLSKHLQGIIETYIIPSVIEQMTTNKNEFETIYLKGVDISDVKPDNWHEILIKLIEINFENHQHDRAHEWYGVAMMMPGISTYVETHPLAKYLEFLQQKQTQSVSPTPTTTTVTTTSVATTSLSTTMNLFKPQTVVIKSIALQKLDELFELKSNERALLGEENLALLSNIKQNFEKVCGAEKEKSCMAISEFAEALKIARKKAIKMSSPADKIVIDILDNCAEWVESLKSKKMSL